MLLGVCLHTWSILYGSDIIRVDFKPSYRNKLSPIWNCEDLPQTMCATMESLFSHFWGSDLSLVFNAIAWGMDRSVTKWNYGLRRD